MIGLLHNSAFSDGTDLTSLENVVRGFQRFGRVNKESLAELFVTLFIKVIFSFLFFFLPVLQHQHPTKQGYEKLPFNWSPRSSYLPFIYLCTRRWYIEWKMTKSSVLVCRVQDKSTINFNFIQKSILCEIYS